jgi:hypothetical protein
MAPDRLGSLAGLCAAPLTIALSLPPTASADTPSWDESRTSMAVGDPEGQHTETYGFRSSCATRRQPEHHIKLLRVPNRTQWRTHDDP